MNFKVITYNIAHGKGLDGNVDIERQARLIKKYSADVACIQEIDAYSKRTEEVDEISILTEKSGFGYSAMGTTIIFQGGYYGNGILSKHPIRHSKNYLFPITDDTHEQRGCVYTKIRKEGKPINVFSVHLSVYEEERMLAIKSLIKIIEKIDKSENIIIAGDFNVGIEKIGVHQYKMNHEINVFEEYALLEKHLQKIDNSKLTWFTNTGQGCIDTIFYSENINLNKFETIESNYSDHSAIFAEFNI